MNDQIRVLSVDDHPRMREGIAMVINSHPNMQMVAQASNGREALECFREHKPDVTLMDLRLPDMSGIDAAVAIRTEFPEARIIILTTFDSDTDQQRALAIGASAFVLKSAPPGKLLETIQRIHAETQKPN
jgi:DNA-binding NarL/FixJ family response regulator